MKDLDAGIAFYAKYAGMAVVHRRSGEGDRIRYFTDFKEVSRIPIYWLRQPDGMVRHLTREVA